VAHRPRRESDEHDDAIVAAWRVYRLACSRPSQCREWFATARHLGEVARRLLEDTFKGAVVARELRTLAATPAKAPRGDDDSDVDLAVSVAARRVAATYRRDECAIEMTITFAASHPLRSVVVDMGRHQGVSEPTARRWALQLRACADHDSAIAAVDRWRASLDLEFRDVEPCPVCCAVLNPASKRLPDVMCATCHNKFHAHCLAQWFNKSHKHNCVICQQPFVAVKNPNAAPKKRAAQPESPSDPPAPARAPRPPSHDDDELD